MQEVWIYPVCHGEPCSWKNDTFFLNLEEWLSAINMKEGLKESTGKEGDQVSPLETEAKNGAKLKPCCT